MLDHFLSVFWKPQIQLLVAAAALAFIQDMALAQTLTRGDSRVFRLSLLTVDGCRVGMQARDPIPQFKDYVLQNGILSEADIKGLEKSVMDEVEAAVEFAEESPKPVSPATTYPSLTYLALCQCRCMAGCRWMRYTDCEGSLHSCVVGLMCLLQDMSQLLENVFADPKGFGINADGRYRYTMPGFTAGTAEVS